MKGIPKRKNCEYELCCAGIGKILIVIFLLFGQSCDDQKASDKSNLSKLEMKALERNSPLSVEIFGKGDESLVLLHGLGSNAKAWSKLIPHLEDQYQVYAIDFPKFLDTEDKSGVGISKYAELVSAFISQNVNEKAHLLGHSMGGQVAIKIAVDHPEVIQTLTLIAPAGFEQFDKKDRNWFKTWVTKDFYLSLNDLAIAKNFDVNFYGNKLPYDAKFMLEDRMALKNDSVQYSRYLDYVLKSVESMLEEPVYNDLPQISVSALVLFGSDDLLIPNRALHPTLTVEDILNISDNIPNTEKHLIAKAGHFIQWDQPDEVALLILNFLNNNSTK